MGRYLRVPDETGKEWLLQEGDPLYTTLHQLRQFGYELHDLVIPNEVALTLNAAEPDYSNALADGNDLEATGRAILVNDIRRLLRGLGFTTEYPAEGVHPADLTSSGSDHPAKVSV